MQKIRVGDTVEVTKGAERVKAAAEKRGKVLSIDWDGGRLHVEGLRLRKRHLRKGVDKSHPEGGIIEKTGSIALANVAVVCPKCNKASRMGTRQDGQERKRYCKSCDAALD